MQQQQQYLEDRGKEKDVVTECSEGDSIFHFSEEEACWKGQYMDEANKIEYPRWLPVEQTRWENFVAKTKDPNSLKWFTDGEGTGRCLGKQGGGPKRIVSSIIRIQTHGEFLLTQNKIIGYSQWGDRIITSASLPEKYTKTIFRYESMPDFEKGVAQRRNTGPSGSELIYTLPFTKSNAEKLFALRDGNNIQLIVKNEDHGNVYEVKKPNATLQENFEMFVNSDFDYLYAANYISQAQKLLNAKQSQAEGLIPQQMTSDDLATAIKAQESLSQKDKMASDG